MSTYPAAHARKIRSDSIDAPEGFTIEHRGQTRTLKTVHLRLFSGYASDGHATDYQRRPVQWFEIEYTTPEGKSARRQCWRFAGRNLDNADREYDKALRDFAARWPGAVATFPTTPDESRLVRIARQEGEDVGAARVIAAATEPEAPELFDEATGPMPDPRGDADEVSRAIVASNRD